MDDYIKKHTFIFIMTLLIIVMILIYSFFLIDNSNFSDKDVILNNLRVNYQNEFINITKSNSEDDLADNYIYIVNNTESGEKFKIYIDSSNDLTGLYYKIDDGNLKYVNNDKLIYEGHIDARTKITLNVKMGTKNDIKSSNLKFTIK